MSSQQFQLHASLSAACIKNKVQWL